MVHIGGITKLRRRQYTYVLATIVILGSYVATAVVWRHQRAQIKSLNEQIMTLVDTQSAIDNGSYTAVTISPSENTVYIPLAKLRLPVAPLTERLMYNYRETYTIPGFKKIFPSQLSISTLDLAASAFSTTRQFDCSQVVYADFVSPSYPINPMWKSDGEVKLADNRTMHIYYAPSIPGCKQSWKLQNIDSKAIADSLKQANSY